MNEPQVKIPFDEWKLRSELASAFGVIVSRRRLSQAQVVELTGLTQPKVSRLLRGHFEGVSAQRLLLAIMRLGHSVEINIKRESAQPVKVRADVEGACVQHSVCGGNCEEDVAKLIEALEN